MIEKPIVFPIRLSRPEYMLLEALGIAERQPMGEVARRAIRELARVKGIPAMRIIEVENKPIRRS